MSSLSLLSRKVFSADYSPVIQDSNIRLYIWACVTAIGFSIQCPTEMGFQTLGRCERVSVSVFLD